MSAKFHPDGLPVTSQREPGALLPWFVQHESGCTGFGPEAIRPV
ncbi:MAG: hypothetical protein ACHP7E_09040 [Burkholderiales bacterium]